jgi:hypothetical protein
LRQEHLKIDSSYIYHKKTYRNSITDVGFVNFQVRDFETDLLIRANKDLSKEATDLVYSYRRHLENYIHDHPYFLTSFAPIKFDQLAPPIVRDMQSASILANVGPMASVAGAIAEYVGKDLLMYSDNIIVENGGDIFISTQQDLQVGVFAGRSSFSQKIKLKILSQKMPLGVCTSSGTVGHSFSMGRADAVCVLSSSTIKADAVATAVGNIVKSPADLKKALNIGYEINGVKGIVIIIGDKLGAIGDITFI